MFGFVKVAAASPRLSLANPTSNAKEIIKLIKEANSNHSAIILFPELSLIGYSVGDLIFQTQLLNQQAKALEYILKESKELNIISIIGYVLKHKDRLYNCAIVIQSGDILGIVPKSYLPSKQEFYDFRYFNSGKDIKNCYIDILSFKVPFGVDILFKKDEVTFGIEICEDLWSVTPPSNYMASSGANLIFNLSASNEIVGKSKYREELVRTQSSRLICGYIYASSSIGESSSDTIFGGDLIISEYGKILKRDRKISFDSKIIYATLDYQRVSNIRRIDTSFNQSYIHDFREIELKKLNSIDKIDRTYNPYPFVPSDDNLREEVCEEITDIQAYALIRRLKTIGIKKVVIGVSGGLDSTLALLSTHKAFKIANFDLKDIIAVTMPGLGTTSRTKNSAINLAKELGVTIKEININPIVIEEFKAIEHSIVDFSVTYENTQARVRTSILMNMSNKIGAIVIGTGDLSEIALGWNTYNGDHMSMYSLNSGIPKTLVRYIIEYYANKNINIKNILKEILNTPVSPELLPHKDDKIEQITEDIIGPYELHDFFLYHFVREGFTPKKILKIADIAFENYDIATIKKWLKLFIKRFFKQQFKRNSMPDGPMVGTISLSPRTNWRMPSDANFEDFLKDLD